QYRAEVEQRTKMLGAMIEPIMIVGLALVVGLILVAMYLPIFQLVTNFGL
ncbi:MAG: type II secretion system F family protein, partial [Saprospiraceae bacterium]|nr:type II secretion system F family protein [Saprospiraceae bacterium]